VFLTAAMTTVVMGGVAAHSWFAEIQQRVETVHPAVLEWSAEAVRRRLEQARAELGELARESAAAASDAARVQRAREHLASSATFSGLVLLDEQGQLRESAGAGAPFHGLRAILRITSAAQAALSDAMAAAQLRRELAGTDDTSIRLFSSDEQRAFVLVSAPLPDSRGRTRGSLHGLVRSAELSAALRSDLLSVGGIHLADKEGRIVAQAGDGMYSEGPLPPRALHASATPSLNVPWNADDVWTVASARSIDVLAMVIVAEQPTLLAFESIFLAGAKMLAAGGVLTAAFTLLAWLMAAGWTRRLATLVGGIRSIAKSDFTARLSDSGVSGQFGLVYRCFNEMAARLMELREEYDENLDALSKQNVGFQKRHGALEKLSTTDGLTQLHNHRFFQDQLRREIKRLARTNEGLCMLIIDIDDFKQLNDTYGHAAGDEFLKQLAGILKETVRETDLLARYGGEEFVIIAIGTGLDGARMLAEKLRTKVAETSFIVDETLRPRSVTVSIGVAQYGHSRTELFTAADAALYRGKAAGKNCVVVAESHAGEDTPR
jgi:diguanylate cyclase (GGDEF)-like protein